MAAAVAAEIENESKEARNERAFQLFLKIGLDEKTAKNSIANSKVTTNLLHSIYEAGVTEGCEKSIGNLIYTAATKFPANALKNRPILLQYIVSEKIKNTPQIEGAFSYLSSISDEEIDMSEFEKQAGVGVVVTFEEIKSVVDEVIEKEKEKILEERYRTNVGLLLSQVRSILPWADGKILKVEVDKHIKNLLGERRPEDDEKVIKKKEKKKTQKSEESDTSNESKNKNESKIIASNLNENNIENNDPYSIFPKPQDNYTIHTEIFFSSGDIWRIHNKKEALEKHLKETGGRILTRFPPEPNGYLHIGHAKAMNVSFGLAREYNGDCYLRFDDTNPDAEKEEYINHIHEIVNWLGWKPFKVTYSSDYFQQLFDFAVFLIKNGYAYVDHQTSEEIKEYREKKMDSPWRNRPMAESLQLFFEMKRGMIEEGKATLRLKMDMKNDNPNMYDLIAYRIKFSEHPHAKDGWCIYPSYDYTHCIVDSLENITHSLCTLEFEIRRPSYYWLLEVLKLYHPYVWEYSRLSITHTVMSKRKLNRLVTDGHVHGWDDPRLFTLAGLRRRGASPSAINTFCRAVGITRSDNMIRVELLEHFMRDDLNKTARRAMVVLKPLKVIITNFEEGRVEEIDAKLRPDAKDEKEANLTYKVPFSKVVYIESSDFRLNDSKDYYGLAPNKTVMLRYAYPIKCTNVVFEENKKDVKEIHVEYDPAKSTKPKGVIHWVSSSSLHDKPLQVEIRLIDKLFLSENPAEKEDWLSDLNSNSFEIIKGAYAVSYLKDAKIGEKFQFERIGYFCVDKDSTPSCLVFNRTVTLRESYPKFFQK